MKKQTKLGLVLAAAAVFCVSVASLVSAKGWVQNGADWYYVDGNGEYVTDTIQSSGTAKFYLGEDGKMEKDYFLEDHDNQNYYFGSNGAMVTNTWVAIESSRVSNQDDYIPDNYWYYFQASGKAMKGSSGNMKKTTIDGKKYGFNEYGQMCTGWVKDDGKTVNPDDDTNPFKDATYYAGGDNDGVLRSGWVTYYDGYDDGDDWLGDKTNLYFYFNTTNNKKETSKTKKINGKTYAFTDEGIMLSGWDAVENYTSGIDSIAGKDVYFSGDDDGHQVKKGWVYAVPASTIDTKAYGDSEEKYMYFGSSGEITKDQFKKISGKYYCFNANGIMKTGLVIWCPSGFATGDTDTPSQKFVSTIDLDWAESTDVMKKGILQTDSDKSSNYVKVDPAGVVVDKGDTSLTKDVDAIKIHYFADDGSRKTGTNNVTFTDDTVAFYSSATGDKGSGQVGKKYYSLGFALKASSDIRYGIYNLADYSDNGTGAFNAQGSNGNDDYYANLIAGNYIVLTTSGQKQKGNKNAKKDADGNYWYIQSSDGTLKGIWTVAVKEYNAYFTTKYITKNVAVNAMKAATTRIGNIYDVWSKWDAGDDLIASCSTADLAEVDLALPAAVANNEGINASDLRWRLYVNSSGQYYFKSVALGSLTQSQVSGLWFQSDYGDKSNAWIPFGMLDNAQKTCTVEYTACDVDTYPQAHKYEVGMTDDYFLNCYWK